MKAKKLLLGLTLTLSIIGCNSSSSNSPTPQAQNIKVSKCYKDKAQRSSNSGESIDNKHTYVSYKYENSTLFLKHYNSSFNCNKDAPISADIEKSGNKINIKETQDLSNGMDRCMCLRDLDITVEKLNADVYEIHINHDYSVDDDILFTVNLEEKKEGMVSYERLTYPYGSD